jgi:hypothetical protein
VGNKKIKVMDNHIERITDNRVIKIAKDKSPDGRRSSGRPRKTTK